MQVPASLLNLLRGGAAVAALTLAGCPVEPAPTPQPPVAPTSIEVVPPTPVTVTPVAPVTSETPVTPVAPVTPEPVLDPNDPSNDPNYCPPCGRG